jgi:hypothetical protein
VNKDLYGKIYEVPTDILRNLEKFRGEKTIDKILKSKEITYSNLKRIKNRMENDELENLGGQNFKNWLEQKLGEDRRSIHKSKDVKRKSGIANAFIKPHSKDDLVRPSQKHRKASERHNTWSDNSSNFNLKLESRVIEELQIINELIKQI